MKKLFTIISIPVIIGIAIVTVLAGNNSTNKKTNKMEDQINQTDNTLPADTTPKVTGIGGIFFFFR